MRIDSHQHFWNYSAKEYSWIREKAKRIARDFLPQDLQRELKKVHLDGSIAVQARQTTEESRWLLNMADHYPLIKGVVGWVDLRSPRVAEELAELSKQPRDFEPYLDVVFEAFGVDRLLFGSDWPVCLLSGSYEQVYGIAHEYVRKHAPKAEPAIFGENAVRAYRLK